MSVALSVCTVTAPLWHGNIKPTRSDGQILEATLLGRGAHFTLVVFDPRDEQTLYASSSDAAIYVFSLRENTVKLFAVLSHPVTAMGCCSSAVFACATADGRVAWIDRATSRVLRRAATPHLRAVHCLCPSPRANGPTWAATLSRDALAVWDAAEMTCRAHSHLTAPDPRRAFVSVHCAGDAEPLWTVEATGRVTAWDRAALIPTRAVTVAMRPRAAVVGEGFLAIGGSDALVGFLRTSDLCSIGAVQLSSAPVATRSLSAINKGTLLACELSDGTIVFLVSSSYTVAFAMAAPYSGAAVAKRLLSFCTSGPSLGVFLYGEQLALYHLPIARAHYQRRARSAGAGGGGSGVAQPPRQLWPFLQDRPVGHHADTITSAHANYFVEKGAAGKKEEEGKEKGEEGREGRGEEEEDEAEEPIGAPLPRPGLHPTERQAAAWVNVNAAPAPANRTAGQSTAVVAYRKSQCETVTETGELSIRPFLNKESRAANMANLRRLLLRYGVLPARYRALTWRFLLELPERRLTAPQFAALLSKGPHSAVKPLMAPFPIRDSALRESMATVLAILAWHAPHFAVVHFIPMLVYPFLQVFGDDTQMTVEVLLVILSNWGQEFFACYPHHPVALVTLMNQLLRAEDESLHKHFEERGITADVWAWEPLRALCTDTLTSAEWLQMMDHALFNNPLWLFLFHTRWIVHIHERLVAIDSPQELTEALVTSQPINMNKIIADTYRLHRRCPRSELTRPYTALRGFVDASYPTSWRVNTEVMTRKLAELQQATEQRTQAEASRTRMQDIQAKLNETEMLEQVYVDYKRAELAARLSTMTEGRRHEILLEHERQKLRDVEHATRLLAMQQRVESAGRLEALHEELTCGSGQVAEIAAGQRREATHWRTAESLTDYELRRLEDAARARLAAAMRAVEGDTKSARDKEEVNKVENRDEEHEQEVKKSGGNAETEVILNKEDEEKVGAKWRKERKPCAAYLELKESASRTGASGSQPRASSPVTALYDNLLPCSNDPLSSGNVSEQQGMHSQYPYQSLSSSHYQYRSPQGYPFQLRRQEAATPLPLRQQQKYPPPREWPSGEHDEQSSAGTVLLRPQQPDVYRLPRQLI